MTADTTIYMDNMATSPLDPRVFEAMVPYFVREFGNAASRNHAFGWRAEEAVEDARDHIARLVGASDARDIIFTSGATESNNLAIKGVAEFNKAKRNHVVTCETEHKAVLDSCKRLERDGFEVTYLKPDPAGMIHPDQVREAITERTCLVSLMLVNNEVGTVHPIEEIGKVTRERGVLLHVDAVQGLAKVDFDVERMNVDLASISGHKMYGPKGVGALYVRRSRPRVRLVPLIDGGGHERGMRAGTLNVPCIVGMGRAAQFALAEWRDDAERVRGLRNRLHQQITDELEEVYLNGAPDPWRAPGNLNLSFLFVEGEALMMAIRGVAVSSGSACTSASLEPSYVLRALGVDAERAHSSIRFGLGKFTTLEEVDHVAQLMVSQVKKLRDLSPLYEMHREGIDIHSIQWTAH
jgi:cysteine desulfurase